ncbi:hypothetical protein BDQ12DRAFT_686869 [Crucibulum laeve]|uniref:Uncharacterized protein n=1 Tax=Crucibulum laeve TaxID=68775 RepID=A0A5C3LVL8_9AGAR|nr:hypothetical protein BDQ12DRAFT_686869 [Crucibulum laeve]
MGLCGVLRPNLYSTYCHPLFRSPTPPLHRRLADCHHISFPSNRKFVKSLVYLIYTVETLQIITPPSMMHPTCSRMIPVRSMD